MGDVRATVARLLRGGLLEWSVAGAVTVLALASGLGASRSTWHRLTFAYGAYSAYTDSQRLDAPSDQAGFFRGPFVLFARYVHRGDRIYFQAPRTPYGTLDLHDTVAALGRFYLLPAVQVTHLRDATVVISVQADPNLLHRRFLAQIRVGDGVYVSRLA